MSTLKVDTLQTTSGAGLYPARAWVTFVGTGTVSITDDGNVSSLTDSGVGSYTLAFTTALSSATYATTATCRDLGTDASSRPRLFVSKGFSDTVSSTTGELIVTAQSNTAEEADSPLVCCTWSN
ncbi:hypothetical protein OAA60_03800 [Porticoccaceae bacterium]|nr:hypothetical protein [Porticoccaceae bacterium]